jgi:6-phosphogluconolactonase (cycloisomerase 2 family)
VDATGKVLLVANYGSGSIASFPIGPDGTLAEAASKIAHKGSGPNKRRQEGPHAHSIDLDAANKYAVVNDLGLDRTMVYVLDADKGTLTPNLVPFAESKPGSGPRHLAFHPNGRTAYVINELDSTIAVLDFTASNGTFSTLQTISTLPPEGKAGNTTAEIAVHPSGRFVYGSNRGADTLAIFAAEPAGGRLTLVGFQPTGGKTPRNFAIDPTGQFLLAANQGSDSIVVFLVNPQDGTLRQVGEPVAAPTPVCVVFAPIGEPDVAIPHPPEAEPMRVASRIVLVLACVAPAARGADEPRAAVAAPPESFFAIVRERDRDAARAFYRKYLDIDGMPVVAAAEVDDEALHRTRTIVGRMLAGRPDVLKAMVDDRMYLIVIGKDQVYTTCPSIATTPTRRSRTNGCAGPAAGRPASARRTSSASRSTATTTRASPSTSSATPSPAPSARSTPSGRAARRHLPRRGRQGPISSHLRRQQRRRILGRDRQPTSTAIASTTGTTGRSAPRAAQGLRPRRL